jgi:hypothetical protein
LFNVDVAGRFGAALETTESSLIMLLAGNDPSGFRAAYRLKDIETGSHVEYTLWDDTSSLFSEGTLGRNRFD